MLPFMSTAENRRLTAAEYLALEAAADIRHEFLDGEMFAMSGGSLWHNLVKDNFAHALRNRLGGRGCRVVTSDQRIKVDATGLYTHPDVLVFCGPPEMEDGVHHTLTNPLLVVEVLSDSTEKYDRGLKFGHYRRGNLRRCRVSGGVSPLWLPDAESVQRVGEQPAEPLVDIHTPGRMGGW
jgi:Uma2 family endonuclease